MENRDKFNKKIESELNKLNRKLDLVRESANLGTFDSTVLLIMVFLITISLSLISLNVYKFLTNIPPLAVSFLYFVLFSVFVVAIFQGYLQTIFIKNGRFRGKCVYLSILQGMGAFLALLTALLFLFWGYEKNIGKISENYAQISMIVLLLISVGYGIYNYFKNWKYFKENFKNILAERSKEIEIENLKKKKK